MDEHIEEFWQWFVKHESMIKNCIENSSADDQEYIVEQLNNFILGVGTLTWDVGLDDQNAWFITVSPNGDRDLYKKSKAIIKQAPTHMDWKFYAAKTARNWNKIFKVYNVDFEEVEIDASNWEYIAFEEDDGTLELILEAKNTKHLDSETALDAANIFVMNELGEALMIDRISKLEIVDEVEAEYQDTKSPVNELKSHLEE